MPNNAPLDQHKDQQSLKAMGMDGPPETWSKDQRRAAGIETADPVAAPRSATAAEEKGVAAEIRRVRK